MAAGKPTASAMTKASTASGERLAAACSGATPMLPPTGRGRDLRRPKVPGQALAHLHQLLLAEIPGEGSQRKRGRQRYASLDEQRGMQVAVGQRKYGLME